MLIHENHLSTISQSSDSLETGSSNSSHTVVLNSHSLNCRFIHIATTSNPLAFLSQCYAFEGARERESKLLTFQYEKLSLHISSSASHVRKLV